MIEGRVHTEIDPSGTAESLRNSEKIVIVPGYGLAVAQVRKGFDGWVGDGGHFCVGCVGGLGRLMTG